MHPLLRRVPYAEGFRAFLILAAISAANGQHGLAEIAEIDARLGLAKSNEERNRELAASRAISTQALDEAVAACAALEALKRGKEIELAKTEIRAPFAGRVGVRTVSEGAWVTPAMPLISLRDLSRIKVDFPVPSRFAGSVRSGQTFSFTVAGDAKAFSGTVAAVEPSVDETTRSLAVRGVCAFASQPPTIGSRRSGQPVQFVLQAPTVAALGPVLGEFMARAAVHPDLRQVDADFKINRPEGMVTVNRQKAAELGISVESIARSLKLAYAGQRVGYFIENGRQHEVIGQMRREDRHEPGGPRRLFVRASSGAMVSLDNLVAFTEGAGPAAIFRFNRAASATVQASPAEGKTIGDGLDAMAAIAKEVLPPTFRKGLAGQSRDFADSSSSLLFAFPLAVVLIYLVLAAQCESYTDPLIILFTVPLSVTGALVSLGITGSSLNVFRQTGIIMLVGLVSKNGILILEFANQRKAAGHEKIEAVLDAAVARLRPILMTSLSTILGILPIALSFGTSSGSRQSLGIAAVGGLIFSGALTLCVVPGVYAYLSCAKSGKAP